MVPQLLKRSKPPFSNLKLTGENYSYSYIYNVLTYISDLVIFTHRKDFGDNQSEQHLVIKKREHCNSALHPVLLGFVRGHINEANKVA